MDTLPPEYEALYSYLETQPAVVRDIFLYCLCVMMVEAGKMKLVETVPGDEGTICVFQSSTGQKEFITRCAFFSDCRIILII